MENQLRVWRRAKGWAQKATDDEGVVNAELKFSIAAPDDHDVDLVIFFWLRASEEEVYA
jgi:hypothetical protein